MKNKDTVIVSYDSLIEKKEREIERLVKEVNDLKKEKSQYITSLEKLKETPIRIIKTVEYHSIKFKLGNEKYLIVVHGHGFNLYNFKHDKFGKWTTQFIGSFDTAWFIPDGIWNNTDTYKFRNKFLCEFLKTYVHSVF